MLRIRLHDDVSVLFMCPMTVSLHAQDQDPETKAAITQVIIYTIIYCAVPTLICQSVSCKKGLFPRRTKRGSEQVWLWGFQVKNY